MYTMSNNLKNRLMNGLFYTGIILNLILCGILTCVVLDYHKPWMLTFPILFLLMAMYTVITEMQRIKQTQTIKQDLFKKLQDQTEE